MNRKSHWESVYASNAYLLRIIRQWVSPAPEQAQAFVSRSNEVDELLIALLVSNSVHHERRDSHRRRLPARLAEIGTRET
jgi:hypothetical protein